MADALTRLQQWLTATRADWRMDHGASLVEYALLIALIAVICVLAVTLLGDATSTSFSSTATGFAAN